MRYKRQATIILFRLLCIIDSFPLLRKYCYKHSTDKQIDHVRQHCHLKFDGYNMTVMMLNGDTFLYSVKNILHNGKLHIVTDNISKHMHVDKSFLTLHAQYSWYTSTFIQSNTRMNIAVNRLQTVMKHPQQNETFTREGTI